MNDKLAKQTLQWLYSLIPEVPCPKGCSDCCRGGPPSLNPVERDAIPPRLRKISRDADLILDTDANTLTISDCPYRTSAGCQAYAFRPLVCRLIGAVSGPMCRCPHGVIATEPLSLDDVMTITEAYKAVSPEQTTPTFILPGGRVVRDAKVGEVCHA